MSDSGFFSDYHQPVFDFLSSDSRSAFLAYLSEGNPSFRAQQLLEFFKCLDWLPVEEIPKNPLKKMSPAVQRQIHREINGYLEHKATTRQKNSERRKAHVLKVYEYYRQHVSPQDKALLESLRDYELNRTGRDINWQHYFSFKSFKKIDEFLASPHLERLLKIEAFKEDVKTYQRNQEKLRHQAHCMGDDGLIFDFDDWCDWMEASGHDGNFHKHGPSDAKGGQKQQNSVRSAASPLLQAYTLLQVNSASSLSDVKKQFRQLTLQHHPDMPGGSTERMKELIGAYERIKAHFSKLQAI